MKRYGMIRPIGMIVTALIKTGGRVLRSAYQQRRLQTGKNVSVAHNVCFFGRGSVLLGDHVRIAPGVVFRADEGSVVEIGPDSYIGAGSQLEARKGQIIRLGRHFELGARCSIVSERGVFWGDKCSLGADSFVGAREDGALGSLVVGTACHLHRHTLIDLCADVVIGESVHTGPFCAFYTHNHVPVRGKLVWDQTPSFAPINVGAGTWIGHNCSILPGVSIGGNSTIATGAVVIRSVEPWTVAGGVPARALKTLLP
jgi:acetyltransferase-like isoleucine patch superfamily enzyme